MHKGTHTWGDIGYLGKTLELLKDNRPENYLVTLVDYSAINIEWNFLVAGPPPLGK